MNDKNPDIGSKDAHRLFLEYLQKQINLVDLAFKGSREIDDERASYLEALFLQLIDDAKSTYLVCQNGFANQGYILVRALLERAINYCYLQICDEDEFNNFIAYSKQKSVRSLNRRLGENNHSVELKFSGEINFDSNPELKQALDKFTSESGKEKTRWTQTSLPDRAIMVEKHCNNISGLLFPLLTIYTDASEALHGTIHGATFHFGLYDPNSMPNNEQELQRNITSHISSLIMMTCSALHVLLKFMEMKGIADGKELTFESVRLLKEIGDKSGLS